MTQKVRKKKKIPKHSQSEIGYKHNELGLQTSSVKKYSSSKEFCQHKINVILRI